MRRLATALLLAATAPVVAASQTQQAPPSVIQNGKVETRAGASVDREVTALAGAEPVWMVWRVPMVAGDRELCSSYFYSERSLYSRAHMLDWDMPGRPGATGVPQVTPPTGPVPIEAGTNLLVLVRVVDRGIERVRTLADDCPIDAGGRTVHWLSGIAPAESLRFLETLTRPDRTDRLSVDSRRNVASSAITAISLHRDAGADAILDRLATSGEHDTRRQAAQALAAARGASGFTSVQKILAAERDPELRRGFVGALGMTRESGTANALRPYLKDTDARLRAEAIYWFAQRGGPATIAEVTRLVEAETDDSVRSRGIAGLARLPAADSVPVLVQLARSSPNAAVRKAAVSALSNSKDPRAMALMEELIKR